MGNECQRCGKPGEVFYYQGVEVTLCGECLEFIEEIVKESKPPNSHDSARKKLKLNPFSDFQLVQEDYNVSKKEILGNAETLHKQESPFSAAKQKDCSKMPRIRRLASTKKAREVNNYLRSKVPPRKSGPRPCWSIIQADKRA